MGLTGVKALETLYDKEEIRRTLLAEKAELVVASRSALVDYTTGEPMTYDVFAGTSVAWTFYLYLGIAGALGLGIALFCLLPTSKSKQKKAAARKGTRGRR